MNIYFFNL